MEVASVGVDSAVVDRSAGMETSDTGCFCMGGGSVGVVVGIPARAMAAEFSAAASIMFSTATCVTPSTIALVATGDSERMGFGMVQIVNYFRRQLVDCCFCFSSCDDCRVRQPLHRCTGLHQELCLSQIVSLPYRGGVQHVNDGP